MSYKHRSELSVGSLLCILFQEMITMLKVVEHVPTFHPREPLYSNSAVIAWCCSQEVHKKVYLAVKKGNILVICLLMKVFIANYYHL